MVGDAGLADDIGGRFDHVLVDEYQDTNRLQSSILLALKPGGRGLTVVGDDAQSIYSFRAATVRNILDFPSAFSPAADIITLDRNYRSTQPILAAANGVIELASERFTKNLWTDPLAALSEIPAPPRSANDWTAFINALQTIREGRAAWPAEIELARRWYEPHLDRIHEDASVRQADLLQLEQIAAGYASRERFLTELTLDPPDATSDQSGVPMLDEDYLILSTIHSAKGQEWKSIFVLNAVDGCIPSDLGVGTTAELEEERRLLYVAMTRAKDNLHLVVPQRFFTHGQNAQGDRHVYASRTRFIPATLLQLFECTTWPVAATGPNGRQDSRTVRVDVSARMRGMWR